MAVVSFFSKSKRETGQTLSTVAIATEMAIEHNYKILLISTGFQDKTIEKCFWEKGRTSSVTSIIGDSKIGLNNGIEGLIKVIQSNRTSNNIVSDYAKVVFKDRLDILESPETDNYEQYVNIASYYPAILKVADKDYDLVLIDVDKKIPENIKKEILNQSNANILTIRQNIEDIDQILNEESETGKNKIIYLIGKYDKFSKYNIKNVTRYLKEKKEVSAISYNTLFNEAAMEGKVADFFLRYRSVIDSTDRNMMLLKETNKTCEKIIYKLQELKMRE